MMKPPSSLSQSQKIGAALPDPLRDFDGQVVETAQQWREKRRPELLEAFRQHVYGRAPLQKPANLRFETAIQTAMMNGAATRKTIAISFAGCADSAERGGFELTVFVPSNAPKPAPCFLLMTNRALEIADPTRERQSDFWPAEFLISRGYAAAVFRVADLDPDEDDDFQNGVHGLFDPTLEAGQSRAGDAWGTIAAWSWGASRALDALQLDPDIDATRVALVGHSRGGKAALWAGAQDERFALVVSNDSGCTGAALSRTTTGETIAQINRQFPHWFCANYRAFNGRETDLPIDQHELLALIAPRLLYIASASDDSWADPSSEYAAGVAATPVFQLLGKTGLSGTLPPIETPLHNATIGHHLRRGKHGLTRHDWENFLLFADRHWNL